MPGDALRSILGFGPGGRVKKRTSSSSPAGTRNPSTTAAAKWPSSLPRTKPNTDSTTKPNTPSTTKPPPPPTPTNPSTPLSTTILHHLTHPTLFPPPPLPPSLSSTLSSTLLLSRARLPPVLSTAHLHAALHCSPSTADRALAALVHSGTVRRVVVPRGGPADVAELLILQEDLEGMVPRPPGWWVGWLRGRPGVGGFCEGDGLGVGEVDGLVRGGWVTVVYDGDRGGRGSGLVERVRGRAAGTVEATGGRGVVWEVGTGVRARGEGGGGQFRVAVPGVGGYLKLVAGAVGYLGELLGKYGGGGGVMAEGDLKGKWDGGVVGEGRAGRAKKGRGEFVGVGEGRTRRWREFLGMEFGWVLDEAVGMGVVEVFDTGSVGRGVRRLR